MKFVPLLIILISVIFASGCITPVSDNQPKAVFDMSKGEIFPPYGETVNSYSIFYGLLLKNGFDTIFNENQLNEETLSDVNVLIFAGPMKKFDPKEIDIIRNYVQNGGNLLVLTHIPSPLVDLMREFNITISDYVAAESQNRIIPSSLDFYVTDFENHTITKGISNFAVFGSWSIKSSGSANTVAWTSDSAWSDVKKNMKFDNDSEKHERLGIVSTLQFGKGKVVIIADDAVFLDKFIDTADNRLFGENIILWFKEK
jgi:hypothetical protein